MEQTETEMEREARLAMAKHLLPLERLLAFTQADIVGLLRRRHYLVGLSDRRLILVMMEGDEALDQEVSIKVGRISAVKWRSGIVKGFRVEVGGDELNFRFSSVVKKGKRIWIRRAKELVDLLKEATKHNKLNEEVRKRIAVEDGRNVEVRTGIADGEYVVRGLIFQNSRELIRQANDFDSLGLQRAALQELNDALNVEPELGMDPDVAALEERLMVEGAVFKRVGLFFLIHAGVYLVSVVLFLALIEFGTDSRYLSRYLLPIVGFEIYVGYSLYRGRRSARSLALYWAVVWIILALIMLVTDDSMFGSRRNLWELIMLVLFSLAIILPLTGSRSQERTLAGTAIFVLGYLAPALVVIGSMFSPN